MKPNGITKAHLILANVPKDYWECDFKNYLGPPKAKETTQNYLRDFGSMKSDGIGLGFFGPPGPGKTTLAMVALKYISRAGWTCFATSLGEIVENIQRGWETKEEQHTAFLNRCRDADFLLIDDVGKEHAGPSGFGVTVLDNLLRHRVQHRQPTFITSNLSKQGIRNRYGEAFLSLIEGKLKVVEVIADDVRKTVLKPRLEKRL